MMFLGTSQRLDADVWQLERKVLDLGDTVKELQKKVADLEATVAKLAKPATPEAKRGKKKT